MAKENARKPHSGASKWVLHEVGSGIAQLCSQHHVSAFAAASVMIFVSRAMSRPPPFGLDLDAFLLAFGLDLMLILPIFGLDLDEKCLVFGLDLMLILPNFGLDLDEK